MDWVDLKDRWQSLSEDCQAEQARLARLVRSRTIDGQVYARLEAMNVLALAGEAVAQAIIDDHEGGAA